MSSSDIAYIREKTGAGLHDIQKVLKDYPKANRDDVIEILEYIGIAVYYKIPAEEKFIHLK